MISAISVNEIIFCFDFLIEFDKIIFKKFTESYVNHARAEKEDS